MSVKYQNLRESVGSKHAFSGRAVLDEIGAVIGAFEAACFPRMVGTLARRP
jgi:hypothetical protein